MLAAYEPQRHSTVYMHHHIGYICPNLPTCAKMYQILLKYVKLVILWQKISFVQKCDLKQNCLHSVQCTSTWWRGMPPSPLALLASVISRDTAHSSSRPRIGAAANKDPNIQEQVPIHCIELLTYAHHLFALIRKVSKKWITCGSTGHVWWHQPPGGSS